MVLSVTTGNRAAWLVHMYNMHPNFKRGNYGQNWVYFYDTGNKMTNNCSSYWLHLAVWLTRCTVQDFVEQVHVRTQLLNVLLSTHTAQSHNHYNILQRGHRQCSQLEAYWVPNILRKKQICYLQFDFQTLKSCQSTSDKVVSTKVCCLKCHVDPGTMLNSWWTHKNSWHMAAKSCCSSITL